MGDRLDVLTRLRHQGLPVQRRSRVARELHPRADPQPPSSGILDARGADVPWRRKLGRSVRAGSVSRLARNAASSSSGHGEHDSRGGVHRLDAIREDNLHGPAHPGYRPPLNGAFFASAFTQWHERKHCVFEYTTRSTNTASLYAGQLAAVVSLKARRAAKLAIFHGASTWSENLPARVPSRTRASDGANARS